jgi:hypothetical protein
MGERTPSQLGPLERANLNHWTSSIMTFDCNNEYSVSPKSKSSMGSGVKVQIERNRYKHDMRLSLPNDSFAPVNVELSEKQLVKRTRLNTLTLLPQRSEIK